MKTVVPGMSSNSELSTVMTSPSRAGSGCRRAAAAAAPRCGAMCGMTSTRWPSSGMWLFMFGCGQSVPQSTRSGNDSTTRRANGTYVGVVRRAGHREPLGAADLGPDVVVLAHEAQEQRELRAVDGLRHVGSSHVVDDDGRRQRGEEVPAFGEVGGLEVDDDVPAELGDATRRGSVVVVRLGVDEALDEVEPHAAHPGLVQVGELRPAIRRAGRSRRRGPGRRPLAARRPSRELSAPWQVACTMTLRSKPRKSRSANSSLLAGVGRRVLALRRVREDYRRGRRRGSARRPRRAEAT